VQPAAESGHTSTAAAGRSTADFLRAVPIFSRLHPPALAELAQACSHIHVRAGEHLFHQGEPSDSLYVVSSGRLEVLLAEPTPLVARVVTRGAVLGELGLLTTSPRSASVRAKRDSELIQIRQAQFADLLADPAFAADLAGALARELQASRGVESEVNPLPTTIAVVGLVPEAPAVALGESLTRSLRAYGSVGVARPQDSDGGDDAAFGRLLDGMEHAHERVLLVSELADPPIWQDFCRRQADRVLALVTARVRTPAGPVPPEVRGCDLVSCEPPGALALGPWLDALDPRAVYSMPPGTGMDEQVPVMARRLAGRSVGMVLSGGGARGSAHIGVIDELTATGVVIDRVVGCSIGALGAATLAIGMPPAEMAERWHRNMVATNPLNDYTIPAVSLVRGAKLLEGLRNLFGAARIEELPREFFCVSSDLHSGELYVHRRGPLVDAVYASMCIPGLLPPAMLDGRVLVDGGVLNNLPVQTLASRGEGPIVAVNLTLQGGRERSGSTEPDRVRRWASAVQAAITGVDGPAPRLRETLMRVLLLGSVDATRAARQQADVVITPETRSIGLLEFEGLDRGIQAGRAAAREALDVPENRERLLLS
jgi:predicted acylesterase/phospholipase RssA/CRP-like cAMP-binding protein